MSEDTPATRTDPALGAEGDSNQITGEDSMSDRRTGDPLDEAIVPPERDRPASTRFGETHWEESRGETLDQRVAQEEPEVWDQTETPPPPDRDELRAGRLVEDDGAVDAGGTSEFAVDAGIAGGAATAEEAAVHVIEEDYEEAYPDAPGLADDDEVTGDDERSPDDFA